MRMASTVSRTLCTRTMRAPRSTQYTAAAIEPSTRWCRSRPRLSPMKSLFERATSVGYPSAVTSPSRRVSSSESGVFLLRSWPGSTTMRSDATPRPSANATRSRRNATTSSTTSPYVGDGYGVRGAARLWVTTTVAPVSATTSAMPGSCSPVVSFTTCAPAAIAARATAGWNVSTEITAPDPASAATIGTTRSSSSSTGIGGPGANFAPPTSTQSAPSAIARPAATAASSESVRPRS